jgi:hypothetical protein
MNGSLTLVASLVGVAGVCAAGCATASARHLARLGARRSPGVPELLRRAEHAAGEGAPDELRLMELAELHAEADRALGLATLVPRSLARVALASGTSLALLVLMQRASVGTAAAVSAALAAFASGAVGAGVCGVLGRQAREVGRLGREDWRRHFREASRALGAPAEWTRGRRAR